MSDATTLLCVGGPLDGQRLPRSTDVVAYEGPASAESEVTYSRAIVPAAGALEVWLVDNGGMHTFEAPDGKHYAVKRRGIVMASAFVADEILSTHAAAAESKLDKELDSLDHLQPDALYLTCSRCGRRSWGQAVGDRCAMPQPDGTWCVGRFEEWA